MQHQPFEVDIRSRGPLCFQVIHEASIEARADTEYLTLDVKEIMGADL